MSITSKVLKNVFSNWAALVVNVVISFFLAPFVVNRLGSTYYGIWVIMMQLTGYLYLLDFGVRESVIRYVSKYLAEKNSELLNQIISSALLLYFLISLVCVAIAIGIAYIFPYLFNITPESVGAARFVVIVTGINLGQFFLFNVFVGVLMGVQRYDVFSKVTIIFSFIRVILIVYFLNQGFGIIALALIQLFINLFSNLVIWYQSTKLVDFKINLFTRISKRKSIFKTLINYSFFVLVNNVCQKIIFYTDALVIGFFLPAAFITYYAIAGNLIEYLRKFVITMTNVLNPLTSEFDSKQKPEKIVEILIQGTKYTLLLSLPICITYIFMGRQFINLWMGNEFAAPASVVLIILAITNLFSMPHYTISSILYGTSRHNIIAYCKIFEAIAKFVLSIILVKSMGIAGVAIGTAIPHLVVVIFVLPIIISRMLKISVYKYFLSSYAGPFLSSFIFTLFVYYIGRFHPSISLIEFFAKIALIMPLYIIPAWFISFTKEERKWHLSLLKPLAMKPNIK